MYIDRSSLILNGSQQPGKLGDHGHCGSVDIIVLLCEVILQDHATKELNKFDDGNCSIRSTILPSFVPLAIFVGEIYWLKFAMRSCETMWSKGHLNLLVRKPHK